MLSVDVKFYIPKDETIPTQLRVKVDDKYDVYYDKSPEGFAYDFRFFNDAKDHYETILDAIVSRMCSQSYDHGASWRETKREIIKPTEKWWDDLIVRVYFRVRDAE